MKTTVAALATLCLATVAWNPASGQADELRSETHKQYGQRLWGFVTAQNGYSDWSMADKPPAFPVGPPVGDNARCFLNRTAAEAGLQAEGAVVVVEHAAEEADQPAGVTVFVKSKSGYDPDSQDWYWAHFAPDGTLVKTSVDECSFAKRGFVVHERDGRLWVFNVNCAELVEFLKGGELAKHVINPGAGPAGKTLKAPDRETVLGYVAAKPGFRTIAEDGRLWVFAENSEELAQYAADGELAKHVIRPGAGPLGVTVKAPDAETIDAYLHSKPGFAVFPVDGRLWVFADNSEELAQYAADGELAKHVILPGAGPGGITLKAPDKETVTEYLVSAPGFITIVGEDGRLWVFREGAPEYDDYQNSGELAKHVIRPGAGPAGMTVKAPDTETVDAYLRSVGS